LNTILDRRSFLIATGGLGTAMLVGCSPSGNAASYPDRDINFIIPYAPGGGFDAYARIVIDPLAKALPKKVNIVPMNVEGAGGGKATSQLFHAKPDGYNIAIISIPGAIVQQLIQGEGGYDLTKMSWIGNMGTDAFGVAVGANSPIKSIADMQALSKKRAVKFTSTGAGSTGRAGAIIGSKLLGINSQVITGYKGTSEYLVAAARGDGDAAVCSLTAMQGLAKAGVIRIIASFEAKSSIPGVQDATALGQPELVKIAETRPIAAPPGLPKNIQAALSDALTKALKSPEVTAWAQKNGANLVPASPEDTLKIVQDQTAFINKWKDVLVKM
jgi:tripartite-type tricarboxylate transporter receptor subunit TctC